MMYIWVRVWLWGVGVGEGALTFEIKLLDAFQRLVDKVETSESLKRKMRFVRLGTFSFLQVQFQFQF